MTVRGRLAVITTALSVVTGLILVPGAAGATAHGSTAAARQLVADEVVGSPQEVSLTPDLSGIEMWSAPDGTTLISVRRTVDGSKVSDLAFTDDSTSTAWPGLRLPGDVRDVTFGPDSTAYLTVPQPDGQTAGWLLRLGRADSHATILHTWPVDPIERYRTPFSVEYANDRLFVEALSLNTIHSCLPQLEAFDLAGTPVGTFEATSCGGSWQADDGLVFASDAESGGGLFVDPATGASHRVGFPSPGPIWNIAHGPGGRIAVVTGNGHNRCETGAVSVIDPSRPLLNRPLHEVFGVASDAQCLVRALTLLDNGAVVLGADLLGIGAALYVVAPDGSPKQLWTSPTQTIRSLHAADGNAFVMVSTSADACGLPHLENCGRVHVRVGTDAGIRPPASFGGEYGDSRTAPPFQTVSIAHNDVVVVSQRNQCLCSDPTTEYVLDRVGASGIERQRWHDPAGTGSPPPPTVKYVALGDSIAAGEGLGDADGYPNNTSAYPAMLGTLLDADVYNLAISGACSATAGATSPGIGTAHRNTAESCTKSVLNTQLPQLLELGVQPDIITLTVGGNDIQFAECFKAVAGLGDDKLCKGRTFSNRLAALRANVGKALAFLRQRYPDASILITSQYNPLPGDAILSGPGHCDLMPGLYVIDRLRKGKYKQLAETLLFGELDSKGVQLQLDLYAEASRVIGRINESLRAAAERYGATVVPLDFTGHDFCRGYDEAGESWVLSPNVRVSLDLNLRRRSASYERFFTPLETCIPLPDCNGDELHGDGGPLSAGPVFIGFYQYHFVTNDFPHLTVAGAKAVARILRSNIQP